MAIGFRSVGTRLKADVTVTGPFQAVSLPAGHVSGDLLLMFITTDANSNVTPDPAGWTRIFYITNGSSLSTPYTPRLRTMCLYRIDNGSLGSSVALSFNSSSWPTGDPSVLAFVAAYTGCDTSGPIERWDFVSTTSTSVVQSHPQETTAVANDWLLTFRACSTDTPVATYTNSVVGDSERVDDSDLIQELSCALYDSNAALTAGLQTQRTTTASRAATYGGLAASIVIKPAAVAGTAFASPTQADVNGTAFNPTVQTVNGGWALCTSLPDYEFAIDWGGDGSFSDPGDEVTNDIITDTTITYGRDQERQLSPGSIGNAAFSLNNVTRKYSPEYVSGPLYGTLDPARPMRSQVTWSGNTYPLFSGRIDDFNIKVDRGDRTVDFTFLDGLALLQGVKLSTAVYMSLRTGDVIDTILDLAGWTGPRDIDTGATILKFWWVEGTDALAAIQDIVKSEGPPSIAYVAPDGTFVFRDRHHRLLRGQSTASQATFTASAVDCTVSPAVTGYNFTKPFTYTHGWRDIVNSVSFDVSERAVDPDLTAVWTSDSTVSLGIGESVEINVSGSDPFVNAVTPVNGTDFIASGAGTVNATLDRDSGASVKITLLAVGGAIVLSGLQLRAQAVTVQRTTKISRSDTGSISQHGEKTYPDTAPWANANDAAAIANMILLHYSQRRPTVQLRIVTEDPGHFLQVLTRTISDRIHITNGEMGLDDDFFVERVTHTISRRNMVGRAPVHAVVLGCEKQLDSQVNPFRFDVRGAGFDQGVFDPIQADDASTVFIFDHPIQGRFDTGLFGT